MSQFPWQTGWGRFLIVPKDMLLPEIREQIQIIEEMKRK